MCCFYLVLLYLDSIYTCAPCLGIFTLFPLCLEVAPTFMASNALK